MAVELDELVPREATGPVRQTVTYMRDRLDRPVTVAELAGVARFSPSHFLRVFKRATGHTPHRYLTLLRVAEAKRLLERGVTVTQAAQRCGFSSTAHLSAVFLRETGVRPSRWVRLPRRVTGSPPVGGSLVTVDQLSRPCSLTRRSANR